MVFHGMLKITFFYSGKWFRSADWSSSDVSEQLEAAMFSTWKGETLYSKTD